jgi:hypothetical protein
VANVITLFIEPGSPWENIYNKNFSGKLQNKLLNRENFYKLKGVNTILKAEGPITARSDLTAH